MAKKKSTNGPPTKNRPKKASGDYGRFYTAQSPKNSGGVVSASSRIRGYHWDETASHRNYRIGWVIGSFDPKTESGVRLKVRRYFPEFDANSGKTSATFVTLKGTVTVVGEEQATMTVVTPASLKKEASEELEDATIEYVPGTGPSEIDLAQEAFKELVIEEVLSDGGELSLDTLFEELEARAAEIISDANESLAAINEGIARRREMRRELFGLERA